MKEKKWLLYLIFPVVFTMMMCAFLPFFYPVIRAAGAEWRAAWIAGAPEYAYQQEKTEDLPGDGAYLSLAKRPSVGTQFGEIRCEKLGKAVPLYYGDSEEILELGAGTYTGYGIPGEEGRILIGAHDTTYFASLDALEAGDELTLDTIYGSYVYRITNTEVMDLANPFSETVQEGISELILYTCYPIGETGTLRTTRYLVHAEELPQKE